MPRRSSLAALSLLLLAPAAPAADASVSYSRDVKPLLAGRCCACHGPDEDKRKAKLRLDVRDEAVKKAIEPGNAD
jgi:cytochrome c553